VIGNQLAPKQTGTINPTFAWTVWRSKDDGHTWATVDTFQLNWQDLSYAIGGGSDKVGNLYVVGRCGGPVKGLKSSQQLWHWVVRTSADGGNSWATVDDFVPQPYSSDPIPWAQAFGSDSNGNLFVAGTVSWNGGPSQWLVRESVGRTGTWQTIDTFQYASGRSAWPQAIIGDIFGHVYVAGYGNDAAAGHWLVRKH
jgi:hypothetical protein